MLYIVSTPIGNLEDITLRAIRILKEVDYIAAEDTRHVQILLQKYEIKTSVLSYHSYSSQAKLEKIIDILKSGKSVALVADAGTPGISDPAYSLIKRAIEENIQISPIPGPSSLLAALVMSGKPMNQFLYLGFLPVKKGRQTLLKSLAEIFFNSRSSAHASVHSTLSASTHANSRSKDCRTIVIFESPHRLVKTLNDFLEFFGDREIAICREITKIYEEALRIKISEAIEHFSKSKPRGEFVLVI